MKLTIGLDANGFAINNLPDATLAQQPVTKAQMDAAVQGYSWKQPVRMMATGNVTLSGLQTIDTVAGAANDRVLLNNQTTTTQNGIYSMQSGAWVRATDMDTGAEALGAAVFVSEGATRGNTQWVQTADAPITIGTTPLTFAQTNGGQSYTAGNGITLNSGVVAVDPAVVTRKAAATIGDGTATTISVTHNLNTLDVQVSVRLVSTGEQVLVDNVANGVNTVQLTFGTAPTSGQYRVIVQG